MHYHREDYLEHLFSRDRRREMLVELFGPLVGLEEEWKAQGATAEELSLEAFNFDSVEVTSIGDAHPWGDVEPQVIEDTLEHRIERDALGRTTKLIKGRSTISLPMDYPVASMDDWRRVSHWLDWHEDRVPGDRLEHVKKRREAGALVMTGMRGGYDVPRQLMGDEEACMAFIEEPELIVEILEKAADLAVRVIDEIGRHVRIDYLHVHEDFAGKSGPLVGPNQVREFLQPFYRRVWERAREYGAQVFSVDTDGNVEAVIEPMLESGVNQIYPMEPAAGMDIVKLREQYGQRLILKGGIDKHVLRRGYEAIRKELEYKLQPAMRGGGVVFGLDHRIPNGTPLEAYRYYVRTAREILGLPPARPVKGSWVRMAF